MVSKFDDMAKLSRFSVIKSLKSRINNRLIMISSSKWSIIELTIVYSGGRHDLEINWHTFDRLYYWYYCSIALLLDHYYVLLSLLYCKSITTEIFSWREWRAVVWSVVYNVCTSSWTVDMFMMVFVVFI